MHYNPEPNDGRQRNLENHSRVHGFLRRDSESRYVRCIVDPPVYFLSFFKGVIHRKKILHVSKTICSDSVEMSSPSMRRMF